MADSETEDAQTEDTQTEASSGTTDHSPEAAQVGTSDGDGDSG